jgi:hypothetical protein
LLLLLLVGSVWIAIACLGYALAVAAAQGDAMEEHLSSLERYPFV